MPLILHGQGDGQIDGVRRDMAVFWEKNSKEASLEEMMLNSDAKSIRSLEEPEVLSLLPNFQDMDVVELACGIGRFTSHLAQKANSVIAVDFMENFVLKNEEENSHFGNIKFVTADVTEFDLDDTSVDLVFSNWILMYLSDDEVLELFRKVLRWLRPGGYFFYRESCFRKSGSMGKEDNPTFYRKPIDYQQMMNFVRNADKKEEEWFKTVQSKSLSSYIRLKNNSGQVTWLAQKQVGERQEDIPGFQSFQEFLDKSQYSMNGILRYEKIFGPGFVSTGGKQTTENFVSKMNLKEGEKVLDIGCGIGGGDFYMAKQYAVTVHGIDLSANMISIAMERQLKILGQGDRSAAKVVFELSDATERQFRPNSFNAIYSRDTILHIEDKAALFSSFYSWTKPGGCLLISDYCCGEADRSLWSQQFTQYVKQRGYQLHTVQQYGKLLEDVGYCDVEAVDVTDYLVERCEDELERIKPIQHEFVAEFSQEDYDYLVKGWKSKMARCQQGDQRWGLFIAKKPL